MLYVLGLQRIEVWNSVRIGSLNSNLLPRKRMHREMGPSDQRVE